MTERATIERGHKGHYTMHLDGVELEGALALVNGEWFAVRYGYVEDNEYMVWATDRDGGDYDFNVYLIERIVDGLRTQH